MTEDGAPRTTGRWILGQILPYLFWIVVCGLSVPAFVVVRSSWLGVVAALRVDYWVTGLLDKILVILMAVGMLALAVGSEYYLTRADSTRKLLLRTARLVGIELVVLSICHVCLAVLTGRGWALLPVFRIGVLEAGAGIPLLAIAGANATRGAALRGGRGVPS